MGGRISTPTGSANANNNPNTNTTRSNSIRAQRTTVANTTTTTTTTNTNTISSSTNVSTMTPFLSEQMLATIRMLERYPHRVRSMTNVPMNSDVGSVIEMPTSNVAVDSSSVPSAIDFIAAQHMLPPSHLYMMASGSSNVEDTRPVEPTLFFNNSATNTPFLDDTNISSRMFTPRSVLPTLWARDGIKCPVCNKVLQSHDVEYHIVMCLTKPRLSYNEDVLKNDKGECVICLEDLLEGNVIARLPCLCIYHKKCIDQWFKVNRICPEHPGI